MKCLAVAILALAACTESSSQCDVNGGGSSVLSEVINIRDPSSGICQLYDVYSYQCDPGCSCELPGTPADPMLNWPQCNGACDAFDEPTCLATRGCHAAYYDDMHMAQPVFEACWDVPDSGGYQGPLEGGGCAGLVAIACEAHDDCVSILNAPVNESGEVVIPSFEHCAAE
jgi:hypothetical protein